MAMEIVGLDILGASRPVSGKLAQARAKVAASRKRAQAAAAQAQAAAARAVAQASAAVRSAKAAPARSEAQRLLKVAQEARAHAASGARKASAAKPAAVHGAPGFAPMAIDPGTAGLTAEMEDAIATSAALDGVTDDMATLIEAIKALQEQINSLSAQSPPSDTSTSPPSEAQATDEEQTAAVDEAQAQAEDAGMADLFAEAEASDAGADVMGVEWLDIASKAVSQLTQPQGRPMTPAEQMQLAQMQAQMAETARAREAEESRARMLTYGALGLGGLALAYFLTRSR